jgi:short-subunit dehydrogenase
MRVFITGASSGLGEGLALHYAKPGAVVGLCARRAPLLAELAQAISARGARPLVYATDVSNTADMQQAAAEFASESARVNVIGVTNTVVPFVPVMVQQGSGTLVAVSSVAGYRGLPGRAAYSASKAAVITFMDALRLDLAGSGVHAMTLCPGFVHTPLTASLPGKLPFVIGVDEAVRDMTRAIERRRKTFVFPWQVRILSQLLRFAPEPLVRKISPAARRQGSA